MGNSREQEHMDGEQRMQEVTQMRSIFRRPFPFELTVVRP